METLAPILPIAILVIILLAIGRSRKETNKHLQEANKRLHDAYQKYRDCLQLLKQHPSDPELRERTLEWGRHYSNLTRQRKGITVYDELALANDIAAACAAAGGKQQLSTPEPAAQPLQLRLEKLTTLFENGAVTELEYQQRRAKLLDEI